MIRQGKLNDAAVMAEIFNHYVATSNVIFSDRILSPEDMRVKLDPIVSAGMPFVVWEEDDEVLGYCFAHYFHPDPVYSRTWELTMYLRSGHTGRGVGSALMKRVIGECREGGAHTLVSFVTGGNKPCERMLESHGFAKVGIIKESGFKFGQYWDDVVFQLIL